MFFIAALLCSIFLAVNELILAMHNCFRTLPESVGLENINSRLGEHGIQGLLIVGGFEVC